MSRTLSMQWPALLLLSAMVSGCVSNVVDLTYRPEGEHKSPLSTIKPLMLAVHVDDQRDTDERDRVATFAKGGIFEHPVTANRDVLRGMLTAVGFEVLEAGSAAEANAILGSSMTVDAVVSEKRVVLGGGKG